MTTTDSGSVDERRRLYERARDGLLARQLSNAETYDRSILSLSSGFLAISIAFISNVVDLDDARWMLVLYGAWCGFSGAIVVVIGSVLYGQRGIKIQLKAARDYYLNEKKEALDQADGVAQTIDRWNRLSGVLFIASVLALTTFVVGNVGDTMSKETTGKETTAADTSAVEKRAQPLNSLEQVQQTKPAPSSGDDPAPSAPPSGDDSNPGNQDDRPESDR